MKFLVIIFLFPISLYSPTFASDDDCYDYDCGLSDSAYDVKPESTWQTFTDEELRGLGALPLEGEDETATVLPQPSTECTAFECDDSAFPVNSDAGKPVVTTAEGEKELDEADPLHAAADKLGLSHTKCDACDADAAIAGLTSEPDRGPASKPCNVTGDDGSCEEDQPTEGPGGGSI